MELNCLEPEEAIKSCSGKKGFLTEKFKKFTQYFCTIPAKYLISSKAAGEKNMQIY